jgi:hypothetical protein
MDAKPLDVGFDQSRPETLTQAPEADPEVGPPEPVSGTDLARTASGVGDPAPAADKAPERTPAEGPPVHPVPEGLERPVMEVLFLCLQGGRRFYSVRLNGQEIFVGTRGECDRFIAIHNQKVDQEQAEARRVPRARAVAIRTYKQVKLHA